MCATCSHVTDRRMGEWHVSAEINTAAADLITCLNRQAEQLRGFMELLSRQRQALVERDSDALEQIVADETDKFFERKGLIKHISSSGRVYWLTPEEEEGWKRRHNRKKRRKKKKTKPKITKKEIVFYVFFFLSALIIIIVLFRTAVI